MAPCEFLYEIIRTIGGVGGRVAHFPLEAFAIPARKL